MAAQKITPRTIAKGCFFAVVELDDLLGALPTFLLDRLIFALHPTQTRLDMFRRRFYLQAAVSSQCYMLFLYLVFDLNELNFHYLPLGLFLYFFAVYYLQYRKDDARLALASPVDTLERRRFARDMKITKLMLATWAMFFLSIHFILPH